MFEILSAYSKDSKDIIMLTARHLWNLTKLHFFHCFSFKNCYYIQWFWNL